MTHTPRQRRHRLGLWSNRDFLMLWAGQAVSLTGSQVTALALPLTAVLLLQASPAQVGLLNAVQYAPFLLLTLFAGVLVDRLPRRPILIAADLGRASLLGGIPLLAWRGGLHMEVLLVIGFLTGCLTVFFHLAYQSFLPALLGRDQLTAGNSRLVATESAAEIGGPGLGGVLVQLLSAPIAILADAGSFLVSAASLALLRTRERHADTRSGAKWHFAAELREGFRATFGSRYLRAFLADATTYNFLEYGMLTVFVLYAIHQLQLTPLIYGALFAAGSAGSFLGAAMTGMSARRFGLGRTIVWSAVLGSVPILALPLVSGPQSIVVAVLALALFVRGAGVSAVNVHAISMRQLLTPDHVLGRMNASFRTISFGAIPLGALAGGALGEALGLRPALFLFSAGIALTWLVLYFSPVAKLGSMPQGSAQTPVLAAMEDERESDDLALPVAS